MGALLPAWVVATLLAAVPPDAPSPAVPPADAPAPPAADPDTDPASTAVGLHDLDTRMTVPVTIDGAGPFRFIVDSGATRTVISRQLAATLGLPAAGRVTLHSVGGETQVDTVHIDRMTLGDLPAKAIDAPVLEAADLGAAGILGIDALAGKTVVIDMRRGAMSVRAAARLRPQTTANEIVVQARRRFGQLVLADADAAGQRVYAVVDTGSMITIGNVPLEDRLVRHRRAAPVRTVITDVTGQQIIAASAPITTMRLGEWRVEGITVAFSDAHAFGSFGLARSPAMLLGMDMMRAFERVSIDFRHRTVQMLRPGGAPDGVSVRVATTRSEISPE